MDSISFDVMLDGKYICTFEYKYSPLFPIDLNKMKEYIESKHPTLRGKDYKFAVNKK